MCGASVQSPMNWFTFSWFISLIYNARATSLLRDSVPALCSRSVYPSVSNGLVTIAGFTTVAPCSIHIWGRSLLLFFSRYGMIPLQRTPYKALSMLNKPYSCPFPLGFCHPAGGGPSHGHRQHAQKLDKDRVCGSGDILADRQTDIQAADVLIAILCAAASAGEVITVHAHTHTHTHTHTQHIHTPETLNR